MEVIRGLHRPGPWPDPAQGPGPGSTVNFGLG
jgi:hypothetical protein